MRVERQQLGRVAAGTASLRSNVCSRPPSKRSETLSTSSRGLCSYCALSGDRSLHPYPRLFSLVASSSPSASAFGVVTNRATRIANSKFIAFGPSPDGSMKFCSVYVSSGMRFYATLNGIVRVTRK